MFLLFFLTWINQDRTLQNFAICTRNHCQVSKELSPNNRYLLLALSSDNIEPHCTKFYLFAQKIGTKRPFLLNVISDPRIEPPFTRPRRLNNRQAFLWPALPCTSQAADRFPTSQRYPSASTPAENIRQQPPLIPPAASQ